MKITIDTATDSVQDLQAVRALLDQLLAQQGTQQAPVQQPSEDTDDIPQLFAYD